MGDVLAGFGVELAQHHRLRVACRHFRHDAPFAFIDQDRLCGLDAYFIDVRVKLIALARLNLPHPIGTFFENGLACGVPLRVGGEGCRQLRALLVGVDPIDGALK